MTDHQSQPKEQPSPSDSLGEVRALQDLRKQWLEKQASIAVEMGIERPEDITELLRNMDLEAFRAQGVQTIELMQELMRQQLRYSAVAARLADRLLDAPTVLSAAHVKAQEAILERLTHLAPNADPEELASLTATYVALPPPYAQTFYWPLDEDEVRSLTSEPPPEI